MKFFFIQGSAFWWGKFKSYVHFSQPWQESLDNSKKKKKVFFRFIENIRYDNKVSLRQAAMGLSQRLRRFTSSHAASNGRIRVDQRFALMRKN